MSFEARRLSVLAYAQGFTGWHYGSLDSLAVVESDRYFDAARDMLAIGDTLQVSAPDGFLLAYVMTGRLVAVVRMCEADL